MEFDLEKGLLSNNIDDTKGLNRLFEYINATRGIDFASYRYATIRRKLKLRLVETGSQNYEEYLSFLMKTPEEIDNLIQALTIKSSNFFRNPLVYEILYSSVLPELISDFRFLKVWSIGCANGEEPYSMAIMINDLLQRERDFFDVRILGTDIDSSAIEKAVQGEYHDSDLIEVKKKFFDAFFKLIPGTKEQQYGKTYRITNEIKSMVKLNSDDLIQWLKLRKRQRNSYNLILCRNVLIYMSRSLQEEILSSLYEVLYENGYLVLGATETVPDILRERFVQALPGVKIYKKVLLSGEHTDIS